MKLINFQDSSGWHFEHTIGDFTLCGDDETGESICEPEDCITKEGKLRDITCEKCLQIINYCKRIK